MGNLLVMECNIFILPPAQVEYRKHKIFKGGGFCGSKVTFIRIESDLLLSMGQAQ